MVLSKEVSPKELQKRQSPDGGTGTTQQTRGSGGDASQQKGIPPSNIPGKPLENTGGRILQLDKEGSVSSLAPQKLSHAPGSDLHSLQSSQEGWGPSITREKISTVTSGEDVKRVLSEPNRIRDEVDDYQRSKQQKKGSCNDDSAPVDKPTSEPRLVIKKKYEDGESGAKSGESDAISLDMVANNSSDSNIKSEEKMNSELRNERKESISGHESESREQQNGKSSATKAKDIVVNANPVSAGRLTEQHDGESRIESKEKSDVRAITQGPKSNPNEQHMLNSEPVQS
ncbi:hypothetical protein OIU74_011553 [Salix koriyanagi]|uniref:Uncharacterized protein n=1 Tax=Salix koriyanagi TaxID=2511006 RepID=A0A9Q0YUP2_9ROSI|nr:hypothetical protein OIU74_011553 [Salix koriyanagi]